MARKDLLSLSLEDLELYSNRGTVKRAAKEAEDPSLTCELQEDEKGNLEAIWSDGVRCILEAGKKLQDARCSCPSGTLCRHVLRTVLAYQKRQKEECPESETAGTRSWDPGSFSDEDIQSHFSHQDIARAKALMDSGLLLELHRGVKPFAIIHGLGVSVRYLVEHDLTYLRSDCASPLSEQAAILGILAFRKLDKKESSGFIICGTERKNDFSKERRAVSELLSSFIEDGLDGLNPYWQDELSLLETDMRAKGYVWLSDILAEIETEFIRYRNHDALFDLTNLVELFSELLLRLDALCGKSQEIPERLIAGEGEIQNQLLEKRRLNGLGALVYKRGKQTILRAFVQDQESGNILYYDKETILTKDDDRSYFQLAQAPVVAGTRFYDFAVSNILVAQAKRSPSGCFTPSHKMSVLPQDYQWDALYGNLVLEDFSELATSLASLYPPSLRSRKPGADFVVVKPASKGTAYFDTVRHVLCCELVDKQGLIINLVLPYDSRASVGFEDALSLLQSNAELLFVSGLVTQKNYGMELNPAGLVFKTQTGPRILMPYIEGCPNEFKDTDPSAQPKEDAEMQESPASVVFSRLTELCSQLLQLGLSACDEYYLRSWKHLAKDFLATGFIRFSDLSEAFMDKLEAVVLRNSKGTDIVTSFERLLVMLRFFKEQTSL